MNSRTDEYKIWKLGGKDCEEPVALVAIFYDFLLAQEFVTGEHSGWSTEYAIMHNGNIIFREVL